MTQSNAAITARGIHTSFGEHTVLDDVDLEVDQRTIFALLGPNGAGKTTIVRILSTLIPTDAGTIRVAGHDLAFLRNYPKGQWITRAGGPPHTAPPPKKPQKKEEPLLLAHKIPAPPAGGPEEV